MSGFRQALEQIRRESGADVKKLGDRFELLVVEYFKRDKRYDFRNVRLWPKQDLGIDIEARDRDGERWAIQCKCLKDDEILYYKGNVTNLWVDAEAENIPNKIIVTTGIPSPNLDKQCRRTGAQIIRYADLESSSIEWDADHHKVRARGPRPLRPYQEEALQDCLAGFRDHDRGQLIMACGTGKTLTSLHVAERQVGKGGLVLYLVPSISLVKQSMREWAEDANIRHQYMVVCSDSTVKGREDISVTDLAGTVTTNPDALRVQYGKTDKNAMRVVFSTYQSAEVVQQAFAGRTFDMIIFDEAHRTAGNEGKSFGLAHHDGNIAARKRLYMTATPRAHKWEGVTDGYSMSDESIFGREFHKLKFSEAILKGILSDYKVVGLSVVADDLDKARADAGEDAEFALEEECKLASIYGAIRQQEKDWEPNLLRRVLVFHNKISQSKRFEMAFPKIVERVNGEDGGPAVEVRHVDGQSRARDRSSTVNWLKGGGVPGAETGPDVRVVSNVRCLSEGVDVPALDGVVFSEPRQSVVDIIQAVGRVMRRSPGKGNGYVIVPVVVSRNEAIGSVIDRDKSNKLILQITEALRAHDDRIDRFLNQAALYAEAGAGGDPSPPTAIIPPQIAEIFDILPATLLNAGFYWDEYGRKLGEKAAVVAMQARNRSEAVYGDTISALHDSLKGTVGDTVTRNDTIDAVAQHLVLRPVFETLFGRSENPVWRAFDHVVDRLDFRAELEELGEWHELMRYHVENIDSPEAKQTVIAKIYGNFFYGFDRQQAKTIVYTPVEVVDFIIRSVQHVLHTQFDTGFDGAVKVLDPFAGTGIFLARLLESGYLGRRPDEADLSFGENRLLAYYTACANIETTHEKLAGERVPFANGSYVDTFTIQPDWRKLKVKGQVGDTGEQVKLDDPLFRRVRGMRDRQRDAHIHVIMTNPPYSGGRKSANEDNQNTRHPALERKIKDTYTDKAREVGFRGAILSPNNSYKKALRWASDRIGESGVIGFIMPSAWVVGSAEVGIRACVYEEFSEVWCLDLLGQKGMPGHGRNIFEYRGTSEGGTTVSTSIVILVKNPTKSGCVIHHASLSEADYSGADKRRRVTELGSIDNVSWGDPVNPNKYHDWLDQRGEADESWQKFLPIGSKDGKRGRTDHVLFRQYSSGLKTHRDGWVYNTSRAKLTDNMERTINYCNKQDPENFEIDAKQTKWTEKLPHDIKRYGQPLKFNKEHIRTALFRPFFRQFVYFDWVFINDIYHIPKFFPRGDIRNPTILVPDKIEGEFSTLVTDSTPDLKNIMNGQAFPLKAKKQSRENVRLVAPTASSLQPPASSLQPPASSLQPPASSLRESGDNSTGQDQGRVLGLHNGRDAGPGGSAPRSSVPDDGDEMKDNITDWALERYRTTYKDQSVTKEDIFYYTYGVLHSPGFRAKYQAFLKRGIPNIPMAPDFRAFERAGRALAELHLNFEAGPKHDLGEPLHDIPNAPKKIAFGKKKNEGSGPKTVDDQSKLLLDGTVVYDNLPYTTYKVNGRTPIGWFVDRYGFNTDKKGKSGNTNYPLEGINGEQVREMVERLVYVGVESDRIISELPEEFEMDVDTGLAQTGQTTLTGESQMRFRG